MAALAEDYPDFPASFVLSRKGTPLLMDAHNHKYRIHSKNTDKTIATYRCIQQNAMKCPATANLKISTGCILKFGHSHAHSSNLLKDITRAEEERLIAAAVTVGRVSTKTVSAKIKVRFYPAVRHTPKFLHYYSVSHNN
jgi:hypothetical protein